MPDMTTLARLHSALDSVVEAEQQLAQVSETTTERTFSVARASQLVHQAREALRGLLQEVPRQGVGFAGRRG